MDDRCVEVLVTVDGELADRMLFGDGEEVDREHYQSGIEAVGKRVAHTVAYVGQFHDHEVDWNPDEVKPCRCAQRYGTGSWSNVGGTVTVPGNQAVSP